MLDRTLEIFEFKIDHDKFGKAPKEESAFFLLSLRILNEISALEKAIIISAPENDPAKYSQPETSGQVSLNCSFLILLAGKIWEAYKVIQALFKEEKKSHHTWLHSLISKLFKKPSSIKYNLARNYLNRMDSSEKKVLKDLNDYFSKPNAIKKIRHKFGFHYDLKIALKKFELFFSIDDPHIFLEETSGNCLYTCSHQLLVKQMVKLMGGNPNNVDSLREKWSALLNDIQIRSNQISKFLNNYIVIFVQNYLGPQDTSNLNKVTLNNIRFLNEVRFPFFMKKN